MHARIVQIIRTSITDHLVKHVQRPGDTRDRIDILVEEATNKILAEFSDNPGGFPGMVMKDTNGKWIEDPEHVRNITGRAYIIDRVK